MIQKHLLTIAIAATVMMGAQGARAQGTAINTSGSAAVASAMLDVQSTNQGVLVPRIATPATAITSPATGLMVYNTTTNQFNYFNGSAWTVIGSGSTTLSAGSTGGQIYVTGAGGAVPTTPVTVGTDATLSSTGALTLATVNSNVGTFGSTTTSPQITVDAKGRITAISNQTITGGSSGTSFTSGIVNISANHTIASTDKLIYWTNATAYVITFPSAPSTGFTVGQTVYICGSQASGGNPGISVSVPSGVNLYIPNTGNETNWSYTYAWNNVMVTYLGSNDWIVIMAD